MVHKTNVGRTKTFQGAQNQQNITPAYATVDGKSQFRQQYVRHRRVGLFLFFYPTLRLPIVDTASNPMNPQKHLAAPATTPVQPNGANPPLPPFTPGGMARFGMNQLDRLPVKTSRRYLDGSRKRNKENCCAFTPGRRGGRRAQFIIWCFDHFNVIVRERVTQVQQCYAPKKNPLTTTVPTVSRLNTVNTKLMVDDFRTPQATSTENRHDVLK